MANFLPAPKGPLWPPMGLAPSGPGGSLPHQGYVFRNAPRSSKARGGIEFRRRHSATVRFLSTRAGGAESDDRARAAFWSMLVLNLLYLLHAEVAARELVTLRYITGRPPTST